MLDRELLSILICPACRGEVKEEENKIVCTKCKRKYPICDGVPIMLIEEAEQ
ncbi:MAG: Trm112 family protein [Candidatus Omnitrophica bacterium]|nr:Trm112 family protein [Candidatus Omnitrophota bacterium]